MKIPVVPRFFVVPGLFVVASLLAASVAPANAQTLEGKFRGGYVCEKLPATRDILRAPVDLIVDGSKVLFARPLFNASGGRVVGSEIAMGTIDANGQMHLTSQWGYLGFTANGQYSGTLTPSGGTLTGTQIWTGPGGNSVSRTCTVAVVPAPKLAKAGNPTANPPNDDDANEGEHP
jgi:hypothetical protein